MPKRPLNKPSRVKKTEVEAKVEKACLLVLSLNLILNLHTLAVFFQHPAEFYSINGVMPERTNPDCSNEGAHFFVILLAGCQLNPTAHVHAIRLYRLNGFLDIVRGEPSGQKNAGSLGDLCGDVPIDRLPVPPKA